MFLCYFFFVRKQFTVWYFILTFCLSFGLGLIFNDKYLLGSASLFIGCIQTIYMTKGKWYEAIIGIIGTCLSIMICALTGLYGSIIFAIVIYIPLSIFNLLNWKKHENNHTVELNQMTIVKSILTIFIVTISTALLSFLLTLIPNQKLAIFDACSNILNVCGILLIALRYKEGWLVWVLCNLVEITTWFIALVKGYSQNALMQIIKNIIYIGLNLWGYFAFISIRKKQTSNTIENLSQKSH